MQYPTDPDTLRDRYQPVGPTEEILVYKMFVYIWHRNDAARRLREKQDDALVGKQNAREVALMLRYRTEAERGFNRALNEFRRQRKERDAGTPKLVFAATYRAATVRDWYFAPGSR